MRYDHKGQSMVEMAIATPLLIFMLIGLFEVGWALRGYITLVNINREVARYAVRTGALDFNAVTPDSIGFTNVVIKARGIQHQIDEIDYIISLYGIPGQYACNPDEKPTSDMITDTTDLWPNCDCELAASNPYSVTLATSPILEPWLRYKTNPDRETRLNDNRILIDATRNNYFENCMQAKRTYAARLMDDNIVIVEAFYDQPQLFGFPLISNPLLDPVPMYSHTVMRQNWSRGEN